MSFKIKVMSLSTNSQNNQCLKFFEFRNRDTLNISFCPNNQTLVFDFSADNFMFHVPLKNDRVHYVYLRKQRTINNFKIFVFGIKEKSLEFSRFQHGTNPQYTIFPISNQTNEQSVILRDFYLSMYV